MKKVLFVALTFSIISFAATAQTGSVLVGGSVDFSSKKAPFSSPLSSGDTKTTNFAFNPTVGYQFSDNWTAGVVATVSSSKYTAAGNVVSKENIFGAGPFIRYAKGISNIFAVYGQVQGIFGSDKVNDVNGSMAQIGAFPAVFINVKNGFGLNFSVGGINYNSSKPSGSSATNQFSFTFGRSVSIGLSANFGGKRK